MSAPREYETDPGLRHGTVREPYLTAPAPGPAGSGRPGGLRSPTPVSPRWGSLPARRGIVVVLSAAAIGVVGSLLTGSAPGAVLGILLIAGSAAAGIGVHPRQAYLIFPAPALAYVVAATVIGLFHDRGVDISHTALAVSAAQWFASGFPWMAAATILVIAVTAARWLARRHQPGAGASGGERGSGPGRSATGTSSGRSSYPR